MGNIPEVSANCPLCGSVWRRPELAMRGTVLLIGGGRVLSLQGQQALVLRSLIGAREPLSKAMLTRELWSYDQPLNAHIIVTAVLRTLRAILEPLGWAVANLAAGNDTAYALVPFEGERRGMGVDAPRATETNSA